MANTDAPRGAWPIRHLTGGVIRTQKFTIASAYDTAIHPGDVVKLVAGGGIAVAAAGNRILGTFAGCQYTDTASGDVKFAKSWIASTAASNIVAYVYADPDIVFGIQSAGSTVAVDVGTLGDHVATAGDANISLSKHTLNGTTSTAVAGFRVLDKLDTPNNAWGTNVDLEVMIYEHEFSHADATTPGV